LIDYIIDRRLPRGLALIIPYLLVLIPLISLLTLSSGSIINEIEMASNSLASSYEYITANWPVNGTPFQRTISEQLPPSEDLYNWLAGDQAAQTATTLFGVTANIFSFIGKFSVILILSLYWNADKVHFERLWLSLVPVEKRFQAREVWRSIEGGVGAYIRSEVLQSLLAGILLWLGYRAIGLNYAVLLALFGAVAWLIPWFGAVLAVIPPFLVGLATSPLVAVVALVYTLLILLIQELIIEPRFFPRQNYSSVILVLVFLVMADAFGLIGFVLAPVVAAAIQISVRYLLQPPTMTTPPARDFTVAEQEVTAL
jgi:predicted PurR-regulated permease PerM